MNFNGNNYNNNGYDNGYSNSNNFNNFSNGYQNYGYGVSTNTYQSTANMSMADYSRRVYAWMALGLSVTFILGFAIQSMFTPAFFDQFMNVYMVVAVIELIMVFVLGFFVHKLPSTVSLVLFLIYSVCNGVTIAPALIVYGVESAIYAFAATALLFGAFSIYGLVTKRDLTKLGPILFIGLIVLLLFGAFGMFIHMEALDLLIGLAGIAIFVGFTAYDTQKIKKGYEYFSGDSEMLKKSAINIALELYLDFINLFLYILRLFARSSR